MRAPLPRVSLALVPAVIAGAVAAQTPAIDKRVPAQPPLAIVLPVARDGAFQVIERLLMLAGVGYGLEQAPPPVPTAVPEDLGLRPEHMVSVNGLRIRDALDRIVAVDPRYDWEEQDGRIIVRAAGTSADFLQQIGNPEVRNLQSTIRESHGHSRSRGVDYGRQAHWRRDRG